MTPETRKTFNTYMGSLLIILSLVCFGLSAFMIMFPAEPKDLPPPKVATVPKKPCLDGLAGLGMTVTSIGADIRAQDLSNAEPLEKLRTASLGISMCHFYLKSFCMGTACEQPGLTFTLSPEEVGK